MYPVCHTGTLPDVFRRHRPGPHPGGSHRLHEPQSRLCRIHPQHPGKPRLQSPGKSNQRDSRTTMQRHAHPVLQRTARTGKRRTQGTQAEKQPKPVNAKRRAPRPGVPFLHPILLFHHPFISTKPAAHYTSPYKQPQ